MTLADETSEAGVEGVRTVGVANVEEDVEVDVADVVARTERWHSASARTARRAASTIDKAEAEGTRG